jgi:hypothetical protein
LILQLHRDGRAPETPQCVPVPPHQAPIAL